MLILIDLFGGEKCSVVLFVIYNFSGFILFCVTSVIYCSLSIILILIFKYIVVNSVPCIFCRIYWSVFSGKFPAEN